MNQITFKNLELTDCERIKEIDASHYVKNAWRVLDGKRQLVSIDYHDKDYPNGYEEHYHSLRETISTDGIAIGAFDEGKMIGFITINPTVFGETFQYVLLDQLFISLDYRGNGIGKVLFLIAASRVKNWGVDKLYICAGSSEDTIAFYYAIGCTEAIEINKALYEEDPRDLQLEYSL